MPPVPCIVLVSGAGCVMGAEPLAQGPISQPHVESHRPARAGPGGFGAAGGTFVLLDNTLWGRMRGGSVCGDRYRSAWELGTLCTWAV